VVERDLAGVLDGDDLRERRDEESDRVERRGLSEAVPPMKSRLLLFSMAIQK
jgi:hypothetical protein